MPELPEVETTARYLSERVTGRTIEDVTVLWRRTVDRPSAERFAVDLKGALITAVARRGKYVVFNLERGGEPRYLLGHMRMSGSFDVVGRAIPLEKHDRIILSLEGGKDVRFNDPRKFGRLYLVRTPEEITSSLGPEPLGDEFTWQALSQRLRSRRGTLKPLLLNQALIAGLGNIYVDEALWYSRIHPLRRAESLNDDEVRRLYSAVRKVLRRAIERQGTDFGDGVVDSGDYSPRVYGRTGLSCPRCSGTIARIVVAQRGTHLCRACQPPARKRRAARAAGGVR